jgi:hypothetical protein
MWAPNVIFTILGLWFVKNMGKETATMRGGGWDDLLWTMRSFLGRLFRRRRALPDARAGEASA